MLGKDKVWRRVGGVSDLNINKWNQSTLFSRMIDFWKTDILTKWHIPYVTMVERRQFNNPISSELVIFLPGHSSSLKIMIHSNFFGVGQTRYSCSFRFLCARLHLSGSCAHVCTLSLDFCISFSNKWDSHFVKNENRNAQFSINQ